MKLAALLVRPAVHYRHDAFCSGLKKLGYTVTMDRPVTPVDLVVTWNRYGAGHDFCLRQEKLGAKIIVTENGYLGKSYQNDHWYALALGHHNGAGRWPRRLGSARLAAYGPLPLPPYRLPPAARSRGVLRGLLLPQRGIGPPGVAMPRDWVQRVQAAVKRSGIPVECAVRAHPGTSLPDDGSLEKALANVDFCITWASGAGIKSLVHGTPVVATYADWIGAPAAVSLDDFTQHGILKTDEHARVRVLEDVFAAMWRVEEISTGEALASVLECDA